MRDMKFKPQGHAPDPDAPEGYEKKDVSYKAVLIAGFILIVSMILTGVAGLFLDQFFTNWAERFDVESISVFEPGPEAMPPSPRLQISPQMEMNEYRALEDERLGKYSYDPTTGVARIPIDTAMQLVLERGFAPQIDTGQTTPSSPAAQQPATGGQSGATQ